MEYRRVENSAPAQQLQTYSNRGRFPNFSTSMPPPPLQLPAVVPTPSTVATLQYGTDSGLLSSNQYGSSVNAIQIVPQQQATNPYIFHYTLPDGSNVQYDHLTGLWYSPYPIPGWDHCNVGIGGVDMNRLMTLMRLYQQQQAAMQQQQQLQQQQAPYLTQPPNFQMSIPSSMETKDFINFTPLPPQQQQWTVDPIQYGTWYPQSKTPESDFTGAQSFNDVNDNSCYLEEFNQSESENYQKDDNDENSGNFNDDHPDPEDDFILEELEEEAELEQQDGRGDENGTVTDLENEEDNKDKDVPKT